MPSSSGIIKLPTTPAAAAALLLPFISIMLLFHHFLLFSSTSVLCIAFGDLVIDSQGNYGVVGVYMGDDDNDDDDDFWSSEEFGTPVPDSTAAPSPSTAKSFDVDSHCKELLETVDQLFNNKSKQMEDDGAQRELKFFASLNDERVEKYRRFWTNFGTHCLEKAEESTSSNRHTFYDEKKKFVDRYVDAEVKLFREQMQNLIKAKEEKIAKNRELGTTTTSSSGSRATPAGNGVVSTICIQVVDNNAENGCRCQSGGGNNNNTNNEETTSATDTTTTTNTNGTADDDIAVEDNSSIGNQQHECELWLYLAFGFMLVSCLLAVLLAVGIWYIVNLHKKRRHQISTMNGVMQK